MINCFPKKAKKQKLPDNLKQVPNIFNAVMGYHRSNFYEEGTSYKIQFKLPQREEVLHTYTDLFFINNQEFTIFSHSKYGFLFMDSGGKFLLVDCKESGYVDHIVCATSKEYSQGEHDYFFLINSETTLGMDQKNIKYKIVPEDILDEKLKKQIEQFQNEQLLK